MKSKVKSIYIIAVISIFFHYSFSQSKEVNKALRNGSDDFGIYTAIVSKSKNINLKKLNKFFDNNNYQLISYERYTKFVYGSYIYAISSFNFTENISLLEVDMLKVISKGRSQFKEKGYYCYECTPSININIKSVRDFEARNSKRYKILRIDNWFGSTQVSKLWFLPFKDWEKQTKKIKEEKEKWYAELLSRTNKGHEEKYNNLREEAFRKSKNSNGLYFIESGNNFYYGEMYNGKKHGYGKYVYKTYKDSRVYCTTKEGNWDNGEYVVHNNSTNYNNSNSSNIKNYTKPLKAISTGKTTNQCDNSCKIYKIEDARGEELAEVYYVPNSCFLTSKGWHAFGEGIGPKPKGDSLEEIINNFEREYCK